MENKFLNTDTKSQNFWDGNVCIKLMCLPNYVDAKVVVLYDYVEFIINYYPKNNTVLVAMD